MSYSHSSHSIKFEDRGEWSLITGQLYRMASLNNSTAVLEDRMKVEKEVEYWDLGPGRRIGIVQLSLHDSFVHQKTFYYRNKKLILLAPHGDFSKYIHTGCPGRFQIALLSVTTQLVYGGYGQHTPRLPYHIRMVASHNHLEPNHF